MNILVIILGLLPGFAWLFFYLQEDLKPEPKKLLALAFLLGIGSAFLALAAELLINCGRFLENFKFENCLVFGNEQNFSMIILTAFALIEELAKFILIYLVISRRTDFDEPIDAMIYMMVAALGFATVENIGALWGKIDQAVIFGSLLQVAVFRFIGTTLLHTLTSSLIGYYWALSIQRFQEKKYLFLGLGLATALHSIFNYLIIAYDNLLMPITFVAVIGFFVLNDFEKLRGKEV